MNTDRKDIANINITSYYQSPQDIDKFSENTGITRHHDTLIKGLLQFTNFTGYLLSLLLKELKGITLEEFRHNTEGQRIFKFTSYRTGWYIYKSNTPGFYF